MEEQKIVPLVNSNLTPITQTNSEFLDEIFAQAKSRFDIGAENHKDKPFNFQFDLYEEMEEELLDLINYSAMQLARIRRLKERQK